MNNIYDMDELFCGMDAIEVYNEDGNLMAS
jgi:hypothetical protein